MLTQKVIDLWDLSDEQVAEYDKEMEHPLAIESLTFMSILNAEQLEKWKRRFMVLLNNTHKSMMEEKTNEK